jgi:hypothetical protein
MKCPKTPSPVETLRPGSSRMCSCMPPEVGVCGPGVQVLFYAAPSAGFPMPSTATSGSGASMTGRAWPRKASRGRPGQMQVLGSQDDLGPRHRELCIPPRLAAGWCRVPAGTRAICSEKDRRGQSVSRQTDLAVLVPPGLQPTVPIRDITRTAVPWTRVAKTPQPGQPALPRPPSAAGPSGQRRPARQAPPSRSSSQSCR